MNRIGEDIGVVVEQAVGSVPLMRVGVHHHHLDAGVLYLQTANCHRNVVEYAVSLTVLAKGMVRPSCEDHRSSILHRRLAGQAGGFHLDRTPRIKLGSEGKAQLNLLLAIKLTAIDFLQVGRRVSPLQHVGGRSPHLHDVFRSDRSLLQKHLLRKAKFLHRVGVIHREIQIELRRVKATHRVTHETQDLEIFSQREAAVAILRIS